MHRFIVLALFAIMAPAQAADTTREFIPELNAFFKLSDQTRLFLLGDLTRNLTNHTTEGEVGAHLDVTLMPLLRQRLRAADWQRDRYLWARAGYVLETSPDKRGSGPTERRGILELTGRVPLSSEVWLVNRVRVDLRDIGGTYSQRYRYRLGVEREFTVSGVVVVPYADAEAFYDTRYDAWNRQVFRFGAEVEITKEWRIESYYGRQNDSRSSPAHVDQLGLVLKYYR